MSQSNSANWMQDNISLLGNRKMSELCITGSHDSGMSVVNHSTFGSNDCNTKTQNHDIGNQLNYGARYFDIRPIIGSGSYYTGHYTKVEISMQGGRGQSISSIIDQVNEFTKKNAELVILNLSHDMDTDAGNSDYPAFTQSQYNSLLEKLSKIDHLYFSTESPSVDLSELTLNDFIGQGKPSVVVVVQPEGDISLGDYEGKGFYPNSSFDVYNKYSDTNDFDKMASLQFEYMKAQRESGKYFLLSWTLTQDSLQAIACKSPFGDPTSILDLASSANEQLVEQVKANTSSTLYPNIIYIDDITNDDFVELAMYLNQQAQL